MNMEMASRAELAGRRRLGVVSGVSAVKDDPRYVSSQRFFGLLEQFEGIGIQRINDFVKESDPENVTRQRAQLFTSLLFSGGSGIQHTNLEQFFREDPDRFQAVACGMGSVITSWIRRESKRIPPGEVPYAIEDTNRYISGYPISLVIMLSRRPDPSAYAEQSPFIHSSVLAYLYDGYSLPLSSVADEAFEFVVPQDFALQNPELFISYPPKHYND